MARLGDIGKVITGNTPKTSDTQNYASNDICFVKPSDIVDGTVTYLDDSEFYISEYARAKARVLPPQSVLVTCIGIIGKVAINNVECAFNQQINAIIPDRSKCLTEYLAYAVQNKQAEMQDIANAPVVPILNKTQFSDIEIRLPSLSDQKVIVEQLNKVSELITLRKEQLAKLDQLVKARFVELFGDQKTNPNNFKVGKLSDVADIYLGLTHTPTYVVQGRPFLSVRDISSGVIDFSGCHYITEEEFASLPNGARPKVGDMLFCRVGTIGKPVIIPEGTPEFGTFVSVGYLSKKANVNNYYLKSWMENDYFMQQVYDNVAGASQINLNTGWLKNFRILIPPLELQNEFAAFVEQTDKSKLTIQASLAKLEVMKKALMQEYFG